MTMLVPRVYVALDKYIYALRLSASGRFPEHGTIKYTTVY